MKIIYEAGDITEAHIVSGMLRASDIDTHVGGYYLQGAVGELAPTNFATVYVADEDIDAARIVIDKYESDNIETTKINSENKNIFITPLIVIGICLLIIVISAW